MKDINEVIGMSSEEKDEEVLNISKSRPKRENADARIDRLVIHFYGKAHKPW